ncbi:MAG: type II toxin-antitoxin system VapC family toxin [Anaerolineae bacterium]|nr:type II toxin-antitoxin system VapC family toxin [Anaerolineae bacterium]
MNADSVSIFLDTNILIRLVITSAPLHAEIREAVDRLWKDNLDLWISRQVVRELASVITRPQTYLSPLNSVAAAEVIKSVPTRFFVADEDEKVAVTLLKLMEQYPMGGRQIHDANIVATMQVNEIKQLFTLNTADFARFSTIITILSLEDLLNNSADQIDATPET